MRFSRRRRLLLAMFGAGLLVLFAVAAMLHPSLRGQGTHQQLGLPPCTFLVLSGRPCPTCGMTTAWSHLMRGQVGNACRANVGGALLGALAMAAVPWLFVSAWRGDWFGVVPNEKMGAWISITILLVTLIEWGFRLTAG